MKFKVNIQLINKCYEYVRNRKVDNLVGYLISILVSGFNEPKKTNKKDNFSSYKGQRNYDFEELEKRLLSLDKE